MVMIYPVQCCPVCVHCKSYEYPSHLCPVVSVDVADVAEGFDRVSIKDDAIYIRAVDNLAPGEDDTLLLENGLSDNNITSANAIIPFNDVDTLLLENGLSDKKVTSANAVVPFNDVASSFDNITLVGEDNVSLLNVSASSAHFPTVLRDTGVNHTLTVTFESSGFTFLDMIHDLECNCGTRLDSYHAPIESDSTCFCKESEVSIFRKISKLLLKEADSIFRLQLPIMELLKEIRDYGFAHEYIPAKVYCKAFEDNLAALEMATVHIMRPRTKHINNIYHHFREHVRDSSISIHAISTTGQFADIFTKPLDPKTFI